MNNPWLEEVDAKLAWLKRQHDATDNPAEQAAIRQEFDELHSRCGCSQCCGDNQPIFLIDLLDLFGLFSQS
jgi:hypothetical protein